MLRILLLSEGDSEAGRAFSGTSKSIVDHLRVLGDQVHCGDCDIRGFARYVAALTTFSPDRTRWASRFHLNSVPFALRTRVARQLHTRLPLPPDVILQFGATFAPPKTQQAPYFLFCDSNIRVAQRASTTGFSWASPLSEREVDEVARREKAIYDNAAGIFTLSEYLRQSFITNFDQPADKVFAVGGGPNLSLEAIPERREPPPGPPTVLFVGAGFDRKGGDLLLRAFDRVRVAVPNARLLVVGPSVKRDDHDGVHWLGYLRKDDAEQLQALHRAYETAHVFCLPTRWEPFGIVYIEAMCYSLPCVGPRAWAVPEMIHDGITGYTIPPEDVDSLTHCLVQLLSKPHEAHRMGVAGRRLAESQYNWVRVVSSMRDRMREALS